MSLCAAPNKKTADVEADDDWLQNGTHGNNWGQDKNCAQDQNV